MGTRHLFPAFIAVDGTPPLVIGNAPQLDAKIRLLCKFAPLVEVVTDLRPAENLGRHAGARYLAGVSCRQAHDLIAGRPLVILDTGDAMLNASLSTTAKTLGVPVNVPDNTALCSFYLGSIVDRAPVLIAISTAGAAPVLGQRIRARIESMLPAGFGRLASYLDRRRTDLRALVPARRRAVQHRIVDGPAADHIISGDEDAADRQLARLIAAPGDHGTAQLRIVDIGRGDPGLLSLRGVETIRNADIILHEADTKPAIIDLARREASLVVVPSGRAGAAGAQMSANHLVDELFGDPAGAAAGSRIVLLLAMRPSPVMAGLVEQLSRRGFADAVIPAAKPSGMLADMPSGMLADMPAGMPPGLPTDARRMGSPEAAITDMPADIPGDIPADIPASMSVGPQRIGSPSADSAASPAGGPS